MKKPVLEQKIDKIEIKIDKLDTHLANIDVTMARYGVVLEDHTRRSLANEKAVEIISKELKPVFDHVAVINVFGKVFLTVLGSELIWELIKWSKS